MSGDVDAGQEPAIRSLLDRYFNAIDRRDFDLLATCFTPDVEFEFNLETKIEVKGRDALMARFAGMRKPYASSHAVSNAGITVAENKASAITFAVVNVVLDPGPGARVLVRGLRYDDELVRDAGSWRICRRKHNPLWQYEAVTVSPGV
jgi:ketosteroid isomerase-like protein